MTEATREFRMTDAATATTPAGLTKGQKDEKTSLKSLLPLLPFALRYRGRIAAALLALLVASSATLVVPLAVRRMVDYGFSAEGADLIDRYFGVMILVVAVLALASSARYYLVMTLGERVMGDVRTAVFVHLTR